MQSEPARAVVDHAPRHGLIAIQPCHAGNVRLEHGDVQRRADVPGQERIQTLGVAGDKAFQVDESRRRQIFQATRLTTAAPGLEFGFADGEWQQLIAHRLGRAVTLVNQGCGPPPVERSILFKRHGDDDIRRRDGAAG